MKKSSLFCFHFFKTYLLWPVQVLSVSTLLLILCMHTSAHSQDANYITAPEVKDMIEKDPRAVLINVLSTIEYDGLHITGSINIPITKFRKSDLLPKKTDTPIITYCMGEH